MARRRKKAALNIFSLSFMDIICCGFGAVILLFVMNDTVKKQEIVEETKDRSSEYKEIQDERSILRAQVMATQMEFGALKESLNAEEERLAAAQEQIKALATQITPDETLDQIVKKQEEALKLALQKRDALRNTPPAWRTDLVGGIPADSEYIIFIIDTSGSMRAYAKLVADKLIETLSVYPAVKGIQLMNADGVYLFPATARSWVPGDINGRRRIAQGYVDWRNSSSSTPVKGIVRALTDYGRSGKQISIYIIGDDFSGNADGLLREADRQNPIQPNGDRLVRIHAMGIPANLGGRGAEKFAMAMTALASRHGGAFVGIAKP
ncbi:MAG: hypothetical protein AAF797_11045 [Planctomycetota bacterium]